MKTFTKAAFIVTALVVSVGAYANWQTNNSYASTRANMNVNPRNQNMTPMAQNQCYPQQRLNQQRDCAGRPNSMMGNAYGRHMRHAMKHRYMGQPMRGYQTNNANGYGMGPRMMGQGQWQGRGMGGYQQNNTSNNAPQPAN
jgi:hypothetical protein